MQKRDDPDITGETPDAFGTENGNGEEPEFKFTDKRHWAHEEDDDDDEVKNVEPARPTIIDEYRDRAEQAEQKLQEYIEAFKSFRGEQDQIRQRLTRDVERRAEQRFGELVGELLHTVDTLEMALSHVESVSEAKTLADGVRLALEGFRSTLSQNGVETVVPDGQPFDPNEAEALRMDPVDSEDLNGIVTETLQTGYRLGETLIRPARVAVGRFAADGS